MLHRSRPAWDRLDMASAMAAGPARRRAGAGAPGEGEEGLERGHATTRGARGVDVVAGDAGEDERFWRG